ncbi:MAG: hypothetical protein LAQ69_50635, partial [Acidobacteriia bacterium]|nr:hypothetical protein [Terriglobia bacterium]
MKSRRSRSRRSSQRGQTFVLIAIFVSVFLIGMLGVATDYTQIWAHRQIAQGAADAACQAGAADIYLNYVNASAWAANGLPDPTWLGTDYTCDTNTTSSPCRYAALNGYSGANVNVSFPSSVPGVSLAGFTVTNPFIQVRITDPVALSFTKVFTATGTVNVAATATCGLNPIHVPIPLVVLHKTASHALYLNGNPTIEILGGPNRSVQVDSTSATAVGFSGVNAIVDLSQAGPNGNGADFGVFGGPAAKPANVILGAAGTYHSPSSPIGDPWATVSAPAAPGTAGTAIPVSLGVNGCPDPNGCVEMTPGNYTGCSTGTISPGATACLMFPFGGSNPKFSAFGNRPNTPTFVPAGTFIKPTNNNPGNYYFATSGGGTTGPLANGSFPAVPPWPQTLGGTVVDGGVTWHNVGILSTTPNTAIFDPGL